MRLIRTCLGRVASGAVHDPGEGSSNAGWPRWHRRSCSAPQQPRTHASTCTRTQQCAWAAHQSLSDQSRSRSLDLRSLSYGEVWARRNVYSAPPRYYKCTATHGTPRGTHGGPRGVVQQIPKGGYNTQGVSTLTPHICSGRASIEVISTGLALATWSRNILAASSTLISGGGVLF